ncbi:peptidoglycan D,D-transpeptidase FtsI family protein [Actinophytocola sediminis]
MPPPSGRSPEGRRPERGWPELPGRGTPGVGQPRARLPRSGQPARGIPPWREDDDPYPEVPDDPLLDESFDEPARRPPGNRAPRDRRAANTRDQLPPWREALRRRARAEPAAGPPWRDPEHDPDPDPYREPRRRAPQGATGRGPRPGSASARRSTHAPRHSTGTVRRVSTGPRKIVRPNTGNHHLRVATVRFLLIAALVAALLKLVQVQGFEAEALAAKAAQQRSTEIDIPATRGSIVDRNGVQLAFSVESRMLAFQPRAIRAQLEKIAEDDAADRISFDERTAAIAAKLHELIGPRAVEVDLLAKLRSDVTYVQLIDKVEPADARAIQSEFQEIIVEPRAEREYPGGNLASNIVGVANWRMDDKDVKKHNLHGLSGLENLRDLELSGKPGRQVVDTKEGSESLIIPGAPRDLQPATDGSDIELTIAADLQYFLQQALADYVKVAKAKGGSAVIMDAHTGEVYALANDRSFDPTAGNFDLNTMGNPAVSNPYEPGSVNKIVTALCTIEDDLAEPQDVHQVDGVREVADQTVRDAWPHGVLPFTTTGIFAKSSNVGTLMLAEQCGEERFAELLERLGLGQRTEVGLPGESPGRVPPRGQWSGSTFGNLPIGQGLSMTVLQMAAMYQAVANDGVRVPPRIVRARITPDGERIPEPKPDSVRVVSEQTARTVRDMFRAIVQDGDGLNDGTGTTAALTGYQISGKTGTGQQIDPETGGYSNSLYWITFAGVLPADDPRFVVGIMIDRPDYYGGFVEGHSAAPLFHDVASYLAQRYRIPLSKKASPVVTLVAE